MSIELKSVSYTYDDNTQYANPALNNINLTISKGEFVGIMGETGCGKSTLLQIIDGLISPSEGAVYFENCDINSKGFDRKILRRSIGVVFQFPEYQLFETTVERDVSFGLRRLGLKKEEIQNRVSFALESVGFDYNKVKDKSPLSFSGGEKRRIAIAGVLAVKPEYLFLDEPIAGLDPYSRIDFMRLLDSLNKNGTAIIMISHNADMLAEYASRIIVMKKGSIVQDAPTAQIFSNCDKLKSSGIAMGQVGNIVHLLREKGVDIAPDIFKYQQLVDGICSIYGGFGE